MSGRIYATKKMSRSWLTSLPTAILALFLLGFPCRSMMMYLQAPAHNCCDNCGDAPKAPSPGCQTLCAASAVNILLQSLDGVTIGVPVGPGLVDGVADGLVFLPGAVAESTVFLSVGSPPLYLQYASLLI
jgi:hypothetical protein